LGVGREANAWLLCMCKEPEVVIVHYIGRQRYYSVPHGMVVVGYGDANGTPYWILKDSCDIMHALRGIACCALPRVQRL
jgi:hypothetical protein